MTRKNLLAGCMLATLSPVGELAAGNDAPKRNILFIAVDDLKPYLGCYGDTIAHTPNIDRLASMGSVFRLNYCQQAVSGPTRASLMTGLRPDHTGVFDLATRMRDVNPDVLTLPQHFRNHGYETVATGKIFDSRCVGEGHDTLSWSVPYYENGDGFYAPGYAKPLMGRYLYDPASIPAGYKPSVECLDVPDNAYKDGAIALQAVELWNRFTAEEKEKPLFLAVGFSKPHLPFTAPRKYWDLYDREAIPVEPFRKRAAGSPDLAYHESSELRSYSDIPDLATFSDVENTVLPESKVRELRHGYYASVSYADANVGVLLDHLDRKGVLDNTIIVLWGDHGWHLGDHGLWNKHTNFEQATAAPLLIFVPGQVPGQCTTPTEFVDIFPTLCQAAELPVPDRLDGTSLLPVINGTCDGVKPYAISQWRKGAGHRIMGYAFRDRQYRFVAWFGNHYRLNKPFSRENLIATELYDYVNDPLETVNLAADPKYADTVDDRLSEMERFSDRMRTRDETE